MMQHNRLFLFVAVLAGGMGQVLIAAGGAPSLDTVRQALDRRWQQLKPQDATERNVLFEDVRANGGSNGSYLFQVSATIRDFSPGYPKNHYYGQTCAARISGVYKVWADASGNWQVDGRMTPDLSARQCKANPAQGVSSIPVQSLSGTTAPSGAMAAAPAQPRSGGGIVQGSYECWANGQARMMLNFTVRGGGAYVGSDGTSGTVAMDPQTGRLSFHGGSLDGAFPAGFYAIYHEPKGRPTVSFRSPREAEAAFCEKQ